MVMPKIACFALKLLEVNFSCL